MPSAQQRDEIFKQALAQPLVAVNVRHAVVAGKPEQAQMQRHGWIAVIDNEQPERALAFGG